MKKKVLIGYDDFVALLENGGYFVDKSLLIKELVDNPNLVTLITRPRRFGKSLNFSMLKWFWENPECRKANSLLYRDVSHLFSDLAIARAGEEYTREQGQYPVIFFSFRGAKMNDWEDTAQKLKKAIAIEYERHNYLLNSAAITDSQHQYIKRIMSMEGSLAEYADALFNMTQFLNSHFNKNVIVLIDEYDTPIQQGYLKGYFEDVLNFFRPFLVEGLKGNDFLKRAVITGIMKVAQESVFSSFNNPSVSTITSSAFSDKFGFTEEEVKEILSFSGMGDQFEMVKTWYNGYIFGKKHDIYNPWSIINFIQEEGLYKPYWVNTSDNELIRETLQMDKVKSKETLEKLIRGDEVREVIVQNVVYKNIKTESRAGWNFLLQSGYLKASDPILENEKLKYLLQIPNMEVHSLITDMVMYWFSEEQSVSDEMEDLVKFFKEENWPLFEDRLKDIFYAIVSYYDNAPPRKARKEKIESLKYENFYHGLFLGLLVQLQDKYNIESNREYGLGRPDLIVLPHDKNCTAVIFEFKAVKTSEKEAPEDAAKEALSQCDEKKYAAGLKAKGYEKYRIIGIGFKGKELKMLW